MTTKANRLGARAKLAPLVLPEIAVRPEPADARLKLLPVVGDAMAPTLKAGDYVLIAPCCRYEGAGLYAIRDRADGAHAIWRVERAGDRSVRLSSDAAHRSNGLVLNALAFGRIVAGKVAARVSPLDLVLFRERFFT